ncbi:MAG: CBS domain-containing protein [Gammaproteobacteria bacterium]|nr:CBS domain-containing protein [Gammaproteobacteria bacterium]
MNTTLKEVIAGKGSNVISVSPDTEATDAIKIMVKNGISSLLVMENEKVIGIFSDKDFSCKVINENRLTETILVSEIMSTPVCAIRPDQSIADAMSVMTTKRIRHLPVMVDKQLVGLISIGDLVKAIIKEQQETIDELEHYIHY